MYELDKNNPKRLPEFKALYKKLSGEENKISHYVGLLSLNTS
jgi:hypothetical protein